MMVTKPTICIKRNHELWLTSGTPVFAWMQCFWSNWHNWPTLDYVFALLAAGGPTEDVLLETVSLDWLHRLSLRLWLAFGQRGTDRRWVWWQWGVGTNGRRMWGTALVGQGGLCEGGRGWRGWRGSDEGWGEAGFAVAALEKVVHTLAAHNWFEGQGALQPLQLKGKRNTKKLKDVYVTLKLEE